MPALFLNGRNYTGGGGNANEQVLTWAEYCALTPEEKMNGTTYYITDVNGDGSDFQPVIYSEDEREIGVWTDGRPLYQKTYSITNVSSSNIIVDSNFTKSVINLVGYVCNGIDMNSPFSHEVMAPCVSGGALLRVFTNDSGLGCNIDGLASAYNGTARFTIQYTKYSDAPGSGTWTPQGVPAVHYDGNEKVVGTWFGETLYEKTYTVNLEVNNSNWTSTGIEVGDIDKAISVVAGNNVGTCWNALFCAVDQTYIRLTSPRNGDTISVNWFTLRYTKSTS